MNYTLSDLDSRASSPASPFLVMIRRQIDEKVCKIEVLKDRPLQPKLEAKGDDAGKTRVSNASMSQQ
jgi:hypothetical protein